MGAERLRRANAADGEAMHRLVEEAYAVYVGRIGRRPAPMDADHGAAIAAGRVTVIEAEGRVVGAIVLVPAEDHLLVENIAVHPSAQGRGLGRLLMDHAEEQARGLGVLELRLYTNERMVENLEWYPRLGYRETGRRVERGFARVYFSKRLTPPGA
ncbi:MAG TPA: GNAT family N-acetyltransferase [Gaiellales bacterium]|nr:GNAT family N-acetyltransferase [Gaiellales bacterium]